MEEKEKQEYQEYVKQVTPKHNVFLNMLRAFFCGGAVCLFGQALISWFMASGMDKDTASSWELLILVGTAVLLTGLNIFSRLVKFGGAGFLVPITGFANSVAAPAIEYQKEERVIITPSQKCRCFRRVC